MGFFSFVTNDTGESIPNRYSVWEPFTAYMVDDRGNEWSESNYEGYGEFGGKDFFVLLAEMNGLCGNNEELRKGGIALYHGRQESLRSPNINRRQGVNWKNELIHQCPVQGYFYCEKFIEERISMTHGIPVSPIKITVEFAEELAKDLGLCLTGEPQIYSDGSIGFEFSGETRAPEVVTSNIRKFRERIDLFGASLDETLFR